jgi:hypothetical protein
MSWYEKYVEFQKKNVLPRISNHIEKLTIENDFVKEIDVPLPRLKSLTCLVAMPFDWVSKLSTLTSLWFDFYSLNDEMVAPYLNKTLFPQLETLKISHLSLKTQMAPFLISLLGPNVKSLTFSQCYFTGPVWDQLATHVENRYKSERYALEYLGFKNNCTGISDVSLAMLTRIFTTREFSINANLPTISIQNGVISAVTAWPKLEVLACSGFSLGDDK